MNSKLLIAVSLFLVTATSSAHAVSFTSDPIATLNEQQKLGPGSYSVRIWNQTYTCRGTSPNYLPRLFERAHHQHQQRYRKHQRQHQR
jgi:hypothetical protein